MRFAVKERSSNPRWLLSDQLGSTSVVANYNGSLHSSKGYKAWGEGRFGSLPTAYQFTGQYNEEALGLYYYGARYYDPVLGRFTQADTIVPEGVQGSQAWDRYAYVNNNPLRYTDPSGHVLIESDTDDWGGEYGLEKIFDSETNDDIPHPDAPPDYDHPLPDGNPPPPHIDGLPDDEWEWNNDWDGLGRGYRNRKDPMGRVWRPDRGYTNDPGTAGEMPHWHGRVPGDHLPEIKFPENYQWGRKGQRKYRGGFNKDSQRYEYSLNLPDISDYYFPQFSNPEPYILIFTLIIFALSLPAGPVLIPVQ